MIDTVVSHFFVRYPFSYFPLEADSYELIFVLLKASNKNDVEIQGPQSQKIFLLKFCTISKESKYEIKWLFENCDFAVRHNWMLLINNVVVLPAK